MVRAAAIATVVLASCTFSPGGGRGGDGDAAVIVDAADGDAPIAIDAAIDAPAVSADACTAVCVNDDVMSCGEVVEHCAAGCGTTGGAHCKQLVPSNGVTIADDLDGADADLVLMDDRLYTFDTDTGEIRHYPLDGSGGGALVRAANVPGLDAASQIRWRAMSQAVPGGSRPAPEVAIFGVRSLSIPQNSVLRPIGSRAVILVARGAIQIAGEIDVGGGRIQNAQGGLNRIAPGPGGGRGAFDGAAANAAQGCAPGGNGTRVTLGGNVQRDTGGGGGGLGTAGGKGGRASNTSDGGGTAVVVGTLPTVCAQTNLVPLRGGSGGGCSRDGGGGDVTRGGGGGGALQLTSFTSIAIMDGSLYAGGSGGAGEGQAAGTGADGGGGAGSGGGVLLEAPAITVMAGSITATGGGGGAGHDDATPGENGLQNGNAAQGSGNGGNGATGGGIGELPAVDGTGDVDGTGGGGGGAGLVHLRALAPPSLSGDPILRPAPSTSVATTTD